MNRNNTVRLKSTIVFAPAGSGKTEELSRRYLKLVSNGVKPERILTLTFTDKAAAEMKERILRNARRDYPDLYQILKDNILRLRISTIHSFCYSLVQRFADLLGIDPHPSVLSDYQTLWEQAKYDTLMKIADGQFGVETRELMISLLSDTHQIGWNELAKLFKALFKKRSTVVRAGLEDNSYVQIELKQTVELAHRLRSDIC
ncbi:MAG: UvrD-helicase domain-containing protein, partial [candidate division WOR-3 bacterium]